MIISGNGKTTGTNNLATFTTKDKKEIEANTEARHTHNNKDFLDNLPAIDDTPTEGSTNFITSGAVYTATKDKAGKATTLAGYGITDAYTADATDALLEEKAEDFIVEATGVYGDTNGALLTGIECAASYGEIYDAYEAGKNIKLAIKGGSVGETIYVPLTEISNEMPFANFRYVDTVEGGSIVNIMVSGKSGMWSFTRTELTASDSGSESQEDYIIEATAQYDETANTIIGDSVPSTTYDDIMEAYGNGKNVLLKLTIDDDNITLLLPLAGINAELQTAFFKGAYGIYSMLALLFSKDETKFTAFYYHNLAASDLSNVSTEDFTAKVNEAFPDGAGGSGTAAEDFIIPVSLDNDGSTVICDVEYDDILAAHNSGRKLILRFTQGSHEWLYPCASTSDNIFKFYGHDLTMFFMHLFTMYEGSWTYSNLVFVKDDLTNVPDMAFLEKLNKVLPDGDEVSY